MTTKKKNTALKIHRKTIPLWTGICVLTGLLGGFSMGLWFSPNVVLVVIPGLIVACTMLFIVHFEWSRRISKKEAENDTET